MKLNVKTKMFQVRMCVFLCVCVWCANEERRKKHHTKENGGMQHHPKKGDGGNAAPPNKVRGGGDKQVRREKNRTTEANANHPGPSCGGPVEKECLRQHPALLSHNRGGGGGGGWGCQHLMFSIYRVRACPGTRKHALNVGMFRRTCLPAD